MKTQATERPWEYHQSKKYHVDDRFITGIDNTGRYTHIAKTYGMDNSMPVNSEENARLIVQCVNQHDKLVEALEKIACCTSEYPASIAKQALKESEAI
jgi:hypothetical protein